MAAVDVCVGDLKATSERPQRLGRDVNAMGEHGHGRAGPKARPWHALGTDMAKGKAFGLATQGCHGGAV